METQLRNESYKDWVSVIRRLEKLVINTAARVAELEKIHNLGPQNEDSGEYKESER